MSKRKYNPHEIESKWQKYWEENKTFRVEIKPDKKKFFNLEMYPYPSGPLHMGHVKNFTICDNYTRFKRMNGYNVMYTTGFDAFGLPAENAAIKHDTHPRDWTWTCINKMIEQKKQLGFSYDWDRIQPTCESDYYKWNQWIFLKFYENGLAYKDKAPINWCDHCKTVLANEQVHDNKCWRCNNEVVEKDLEQWFFRITKYADELNDELDTLPSWPERVIKLQKNWIGRSYGADIDFTIKETGDKLTVFTTRPDTIFGATYMVLAPEHPIVKERLNIMVNKDKVSDYVSKSKKVSLKDRIAQEKEMEGVNTGLKFINPLSGKEGDIYISDYVLMEYGTGAIMAVPAHDQRDFEFAKKYGLPIPVVIAPKKNPGLEEEDLKEAYIGEGILKNSGEFNGLDSRDALQKITEYIEEKGLGKGTIRYRLRDWLISRQRYWGTPIPVIYCDKCGIIPIPEKDLPVELPRDAKFTGEGNPLETVKEFIDCKCPKCGSKARRETDTMDTFVDSSWYFLRYCDPKNDKLPFDKEKASYWMPVDKYTGGIEHAIMHLLYARFFVKALRDLGYFDKDEPFMDLFTHGMILKDGEVMSKSKGNTVDPDEIIKEYGSDTLRLYILFMAPPGNETEWTDSGIAGSFKFLNRVWNIVTDNPDKITASYSGGDLTDAEKEIMRKTHQSIKKVTEDIEKYHFNTGISTLMEFTNLLYKYCNDVKNLQTERGKAVFSFAVRALIKLLHPYTPHITEELWQVIGEKEHLSTGDWINHDKSFLEAEEMVIAIQVNGKLRGSINADVNEKEEKIKEMALNHPNVQKYIAGGVKKVIYVKGRLVSIVV